MFFYNYKMNSDLIIMIDELVEKVINKNPNNRYFMFDVFTTKNSISIACKGVSKRLSLTKEDKIPSLDRILKHTCLQNLQKHHPNTKFTINRDTYMDKDIVRYYFEFI